MIPDLLSHYNMSMALICIERHIKQNKENKMKNSQYPRIKKSSCSVVLFTSEKSGFLLENLRGEALNYTYDLYSYRTDWVESQFNDCPEWLIKKLGYLEDKEQINLILDMARNHGMKTSVLCKRPGAIFLCFKNFDDIHMQVVGPSASKRGYQHFDLGFLSKEDRKVNKGPEMDKVNAEVEEQLIEALKFDDWPKVGDKVVLVSLGLSTFNKEVEITYSGNGVGCYKFVGANDEFTFSKKDVVFREINNAEKELTEELSKKGVQDVVILANQIINGEFDCLKYIPKEER